MVYKTLIRKIDLVILIILCFLSIALVKPAYCLGSRPPRTPYNIRVAVIDNKPYITLSVRGAYQVIALDTGKLLSEKKFLWKKKVTPTPSGIKINQDDFNVKAIRIKPKKEANIYINNRRFRGSIDIIHKEKNRILVVNNIDIEDYIYGVIYHETSPYWPKEALRVQTIVSRSFALSESNLNKDADYHLTATIYSQLYGGRTSERYRSNRIVNQTQGKVLTYRGKVLPTYFHATCGGHTEDASQIWDIDIAPLKGVKCPYCRKSPHFSWEKEVLLSVIETKLKKGKKITGKIISIEPKEVDPSGRITDLIITTNKEKITISAYRFRLLIGPNIIRSTNFTLIISPGKFALFSGLGWGHGVGLCQWGSYFMAKRGYKAEEILEYYYPGSEIKNIEDVIEQ